KRPRKAGLRQETNIKSLVLLLCFRHAAHNNNRNPAEAAEFACERGATWPGHDVISDEQPKCIAQQGITQHSERFMRRFGRQNGKTCFAQDSLAQAQLCSIVINEQDFRHRNSVQSKRRTIALWLGSREPEFQGLSTLLM